MSRLIATIVAASLMPLRCWTAAGNAAGDIEVAGEFLPGHPDITVEREVLEAFRNRTRGADRRSGLDGQRLDELHVFFGTDALAGRNNPLRLGDGGVDRDTHRKVISVFAQSRHQCGDPVGGGSFLEELLLAQAGDRSGLFEVFSAVGGRFRRLSNQMRSDDNPLNFVGTLVNGGDFRIAVGALDLHPLEIAAAAENLKGVVGDLQRNVGGILLGHGRFHSIGLVMFLKFGRAVDQKPRTAQLGSHVRDLKGNRLLKGDRLSELDPFLGVGERVFKRALRDAQRLGCDADPPAVEGGHRNFEAVPFLGRAGFPWEP